MIADINREVPLVQQTSAEHLEKVFGWNGV